MTRAEGLVVPQEGPNVGGLAEQRGQKKRTLRGRCALVLLLTMVVAGYGAMIYLGQLLFVK